jgi:resuscitation-promoting factor RpfB
MRRMLGATAVLCLVLAGTVACAGDPGSAAGQLTEQTPAVETTTATAQPEPTPTTESPSPTPVVVTEQVTETRTIPYGKRNVYDSSLTKGVRNLRTRGVDGVKTLTYEVTTVDGVQTEKKLVGEKVTRRPVTEVTVIGTKTLPKPKPKPKPEPKGQCDPNYGGCVPIASDVDCAGGSGNGPAYVEGPVDVTGDDIYDLDRDHDGVACEDD